MNSVYEWLQKWFQTQCNGDWEHEYGITVETVDNPGWYVTINLTGTKNQDCYFAPIQYEMDQNNWYFCKVENNNFEASCGPNHLKDVLQVFRNWVEKTGCKSSV